MLNTKQTADLSTLDPLDYSGSRINNETVQLDALGGVGRLSGNDVDGVSSSTPAATEVSGELTRND